MEPTIYLFFRGNCLEAMTHCAEVLGGEIGGVFLNGDARDPESRMPGSDDLVMNMAMTLGSAMVMASDVPDEMYNKPQGFRVSNAPTSREEFDRIHDALERMPRVSRWRLTRRSGPSASSCLPTDTVRHGCSITRAIRVPPERKSTHAEALTSVNYAPPRRSFEGSKFSP